MEHACSSSSYLDVDTGIIKDNRNNFWICFWMINKPLYESGIAIVRLIDLKQLSN